MGFWSNVGSFFKSAAKEVASGVAKATKYVGEKLKEAGVDSFIMMSDKLTLVIQGDAEKVNAAIFPEQ